MAGLLRKPAATLTGYLHVGTAREPLRRFFSAVQEVFALPAAAALCASCCARSPHCSIGFVSCEFPPKNSHVPMGITRVTLTLYRDMAM